MFLRLLKNTKVFTMIKVNAVKVRDDATKLGEMTNVARTKKEYNANEKEIEDLEQNYKS